MRYFAFWMPLITLIITSIVFEAFSADSLISSDYTSSLQSFSLKKSAEKAIKTITSDTLFLNCLSHTTQPSFIGTAHGILIHAGLEKVAAILDDFSTYEDLFEDIDEIKILSQLHQTTDGKKENTYFRIHTEQNIPLPFVPNAHVTSDYWITRPTPTLLIYRYQLVKDPKHDDVRHSDGVIILEKRGEKETAFFEIDFLNANWGIVESIAPGRIWPDSIKGFLRTDLALKAFAESDDDEKDQTEKRTEKRTKMRKEARKKARGLLDSKQVEACIQTKTPALPYLKSFLD